MRPGDDGAFAAVMRRRRRGLPFEDEPSGQLTTEANNSPAFATITTEAGVLLVTDN